MSGKLKRSTNTNTNQSVKFVNLPPSSSNPLVGRLNRFPLSFGTTSGFLHMFVHLLGEAFNGFCLVSHKQSLEVEGIVHNPQSRCMVPQYPCDSSHLFQDRVNTPLYLPPLPFQTVTLQKSVNGLSAWITQKTLTLSSDASILANNSSPKTAVYRKDRVVCGAGLWCAAQSSCPMWRRFLRTWVLPNPLLPDRASPALAPAQDNIQSLSSCKASL